MTVSVKKIKSKLEASVFAKHETLKLIAELNLKKNDKILIKPNFCFPKPPSTGITTHYEVIIGVLDALKEFTYVKIIESSPTSHNFEDNIVGWGGLDVLKQYPNIELINLCNEPAKEVEIQGFNQKFNIQLAEILFDYDVLINLPVPKIHLHAGVTMGIKNLYGLLSVKNKSQYHPVIHDFVFGLSKFFKPDLTIFDGIEAMEGMGPIFGTPANAMFVAASRDVIAIDAIGSQILGVDIADVPYLKQAMLNHFGTINTDHISVLGDKLRLNFKKVETLPCQIANILLKNKKVTLEMLSTQLEVPEQTRKNLPVFMKKMVENGALEKNEEFFSIPVHKVNRFLELFPETNKVFRKKQSTVNSTKELESTSC